MEYCFMFFGILLLSRSVGVNSIGVNTIILLLSYLNKLFSPLNDLGHNINLIANDAYKVSRIFEFVPAADERFNPGEDKLENKRLRKEKICKIDIRNLEIEIGTFHKKDLNMSFEAGKLSCIVGASGSGKTTLIGCLLGLKEYKSGDIIINNKYKVNSLFYNSSKVCLTLQNGCIFDRSVMDNLCYPMHTPNKNINKNIKRFKLENLIQRTQNLDNFNLEKVISGGEKKRISFVRTASRRGDVYIFDEPTNDLDTENVEKLLEVIQRLKKKNLVIVISHDKRLVSISDYVYDI
ncbi:MAG: ABC transporter ATP-binding protein/permease [Clostridia bacterium]|nr:ABC transporter ATP-binding protein/permease [Clostridia bacterium]